MVQLPHLPAQSCPALPRPTGHGAGVRRPRLGCRPQLRAEGGGPLRRPVMIPLATNQLPQLIVYSRKGASPASGCGGASPPCTGSFSCMLCCSCFQGHRGAGFNDLYVCVRPRRGYARADTLGPARLLFSEFLYFFIY